MFIVSGVATTSTSRVRNDCCFVGRPVGRDSKAFKTSRFTISHTFDSMLVPKDGVIKPKSMNICLHIVGEATTARFLAYKEGDDGVLNQKYYFHTDC